MSDSHEEQDLRDELLQRVHEVGALLEAIEGGELFAAAPARAEDRRRHQCGVSLLTLLRRQVAELKTLLSDLDPATLRVDGTGPESPVSCDGCGSPARPADLARASAS